MQKVYKSDFFLITGFLGSGKTTFLKYLLKTSGEKYRIAIIQNEFASLGTDGTELAITGKDFKLVEINNGSVFCVCQMENFITALDNLLTDYKPEMIFLEASGLSDPVNIIELLRHEKIKLRLNLRHILTIADTPMFFKSMEILSRYRHQLMIADTVILNKTDLYKRETTEIENVIRELNPFAKIICTSFCEIPVIHTLYHPDVIHKPAENFVGHKSEGRPDINTFVLKTNYLISFSDLKKMINELTREFIRIKGFVNLTGGEVMGVQTVFEQIRFKKVTGYSGPAVLLFFGKNTSMENIKEKYNNLFIRR